MNPIEALSTRQLNRTLHEAATLAKIVNTSTQECRMKPDWGRKWS
jgi:hypothetical protein